MKTNEGVSETNEDEMQWYFISKLLLFRRFPITLYYFESSIFLYTVKLKFQTTSIKQSIAFRDHCFDTTSLLRST